MLHLIHDDVPVTRAVRFPYLSPLPQGGRLQVQTCVAELFLAQAAILAAPDGSRQSGLAVERRDELLAGMTDHQKRHVSTIAAACMRLVSR